ncbi:hypothetical protein B0H17DRAFT_972841 [Mycena rosella]|uniref:ABC transporter domain-containing protein n=1 Tax=Mycena rosella TaxID=1033263 RepID=A0AAD7GWL6_MYCRO|nr:hypothetical protein B0H17DRAFT_972841 [Mycena rosella]
MAPPLFWRQFCALFLKNWIVFSKHPFLNIFRCLVFPVAVGILLSEAQQFLTRPADLGLGEPAPVRALNEEFQSGKLVWVDVTDGNSSPSPADIMARITSDFSTSQLDAIKKISNPQEFLAECHQNFRGLSGCYAGLMFNDIPRDNASAPIDYTLLVDSGLGRIDVVHHSGDYETRVMPLQWAVDQAIIELKFGLNLSTPLDWPFTIGTNGQNNDDLRLQYIGSITAITVLAFLASFLGLPFQLAGFTAGERASQVTAHMKAMGLLDSARIISTHVFFSLVYLPSWIIVTFIWYFKIWTHTNFGILLAINIFFGLSLASWSMFIATPFGKSPQLAALAATFGSVGFAAIPLFASLAGYTQVAFTIIFPPSFYVFAIRAIDSLEEGNPPPGPPLYSLLGALFAAAILNIFLWPFLAVVMERRLYETQGYEPNEPRLKLGRRRTDEKRPIDVSLAVSIEGLGKTFKSFFGRKSKNVTAIADLTMDVPRSGIFVLLGSNGAGKSTLLSILGGLTRASGGIVTFEGGTSRPPRGILGIVPQKNVLFPELSCLETLKVWSAVKWSASSRLDEDLEQLLRDCDLQHKIYSRAGTLSGGQKRKLQLAIGLAGGSKLLLVDEATSGVDPLSRRALWRTMVSFRKERTILLTTHLLDEAELLADHIAILAAPGKLVASDSPVAMKQQLGSGYSVQVALRTPAAVGPGPLDKLLRQIRTIAPEAHMSLDSPQRPLFHLVSPDAGVVGRVLALLDAQAETYGVVSYDVLGTTIEDIFLNVMAKNQGAVPVVTDSDPDSDPVSDADIVHDAPLATLKLSDGRAISPLRQALVIFYKRALIFRRSWLAPLAAVALAVVVSVLSVRAMNKRPHSCATRTDTFQSRTPLYAPLSFWIPHTIPGDDFDVSPVFNSPPGLISTLGSSVARLNISDFPDASAFTANIHNNFATIRTGGVSFDLVTGTTTFAWEGSNQGILGPIFLNLATNLAFNRALNASGQAANTSSLIQPSLQSFPQVHDEVFPPLEWLIFFGLVMSVFPAFLALYVAKERESQVKSMQLSNGISNPMGLWLGHLMFDSIFILTVATLVTVLFARLSQQFYGLGFLWLVMVLYGIAGTLLAYCMTLALLSPLSVFGAAAGYQLIMFILYIASYLIVFTYADPASADGMLRVTHFTLSLLSPVASLTRAGLISINLFSLLCTSESDNVGPSALIGVTKYGGPIIYLIVQSIALFALLFWVDSGSVLFQRLRRAHTEIVSAQFERPSKEDVDLEAAQASEPSNLLQVLDATKTFGLNTAVDGLSFGVAPDTVFCMVGPNGAGKSTSINMMSGNIIPDRGDVLINKASIITEARTARISLGVCPQFSAIDAQLSVREHLMIYGRLKGLTGEGLNNSINSLLLTTGLHLYTDRLAGKLSGGNQRKLALAIALIGNPPVILIDEFSTGIDAKMKRDMWHLLRRVAASKAFVITTHSMEEAAALATKVGILAVRLLAVGTAEGLSSRYSTYEVHFTCRTDEDTARAERLMAVIPGARMVEDLATRFEVPTANVPLADLFRTLATQGDFPEYTVAKATLESMFLKVIRDSNAEEVDNRESHTPRRSWPFLRR